MEVRELKDLKITMSKDEHQKYIVVQDDSTFFDFNKLIKHIQIFQIIDILDFKETKNDNGYTIYLKAIVK